MRNFKLLLLMSLLISFSAIQTVQSQKLSTVTSIGSPSDTLKNTNDTVILTFTQNTYKYGLHPFIITLIPTKISGTPSGGAYLQYSDDNVNWNNYSLTDTAVLSNAKLITSYKIHTWIPWTPASTTLYPHPYWRILSRCTSAAQVVKLDAIFQIRE